MKAKLTQSWFLPLPGLQFFIIVLLIVGIFFRFVHLGQKVYWHDETLTSLTISGYTKAEMFQQSFAGHSRVIGIQNLQKYQHTNPEKNTIDSINSLATDFPEHPPLYYLMSRLWVQLFGDSIAMTRSVSAVMSLLAFPCIYWLCLELFNSTLVGWIAVALLAVSPFHVLYAQEAREYSLWGVTVLLASAALLRAMRLKSFRSWIIYAVSITLAIYSYTFSLFVLLGHGIYVIIIEKFKLTKTSIAYGIASLAAFLAFSPWLLIIATSLPKVQKTMEWATQHMSLAVLINAWIYNLSYVFMDFWYIFSYYPNSPYNLKFAKYLIPLILTLVVYSIYFLCRYTERQVYLFILILIGSTALALMLPDLISGGYRSTMARYLTPCYLGIELAVAYFLARQINPVFSSRDWQRKLGQFVLVTLISGGILSCAVSSQAETWWNKRTTSYDDLRIAHIINQASAPLFITYVKNVESVTSGGLTLSHLFEPKVQLLVMSQLDMLKIPDNYSDIFLEEPSQELRSRLEKEHYKIQRLYWGRKANLWKLVK